MPKMLNGIEVPTKGRIVWVRGRGVEDAHEEVPAQVLDGGNLAPDLFVFAREGFGPKIGVIHESEPGLTDGQLRWRWPPREEQPAAVVTAPAEESPEALKAVIAKLRADIDGFIVEQDKLIAERAELRASLGNESNRARTLVEERDRLQGLLNEIERVFGNAAVYDEARGDTIEKARIAHKGGAEGARASNELIELRRKHALACNYLTEVRGQVEGLLANAADVLLTGKAGG